MESNSTGGSNYDDMHSDQLDNLSNLIINNGGGSQVNGGAVGSGMGAFGEDTDNMLLEQYERDLDKGINDGHISERDQCYQRLFQSFQTSACTVAQMFKDKMSTPGSTSSLTSQQQQPPQLTSWQSFQSSAGAITLLYKDSLEACKTHYDIGVSVGQQRKLKELITWLKKKRRRTIRKDELISFLIGKQHPPASASTGSNVASGGGPQASLASMFMMMNPSSNSTSSTTTNNSTPSQQSNNIFFNGLNNKHQQSTQTVRGSVNNNASLGSSANSATCPANLAAIGQPNDTSSDLATFREALIMHNRSRDGPLPHSHHLQSYVNHQHHHSSHQPPCEDLDCFFCEQIATHAEPHKRSSSSFMFGDNMESSPTRKRSRFY